MSRFMAGWIAASVVVLATTAVQAQTLYPDDSMIIRRGPYGALPVGPVRGGYLDDEAYEDAVPSLEVVKMVRSLGFKPLGPAVRRRGVYTVSAVNRQGEEGRVVVDAYTGRIVRFVSTAVGNAEPGGPPAAASTQPPKADVPTSRPPVPRVASRTPPSQAPTSAPPQPTQAPATTAAAMPETRGVGAEQSAVAQAKPAVATSGPAAAKPSVQLQPTQEMPPVQGLD